jgi:NADP-dependent 3-hydroxy acid dehydrogenase YdfG
MSRIALVAGASGGIGRAISSHLLNQGYAVARLSRSITPEETASTLSVACDVVDRACVFSAIEKVISHFGRIDLFVNTVGIAGARKVLDLQAGDMESFFNTNVMGALWLYQAIVERMIKLKSGYIVNIGSLRSHTAGISKAGYCASKAAATQLTNVLAKECKDSGIKITTIHPGYVNNSIYKNGYQKIPFIGRLATDQSKFEYFHDTIEVEDIAKMIICLDSLSPNARVDELCMGRLWGN